ncbi:MAG: hypothetical protein LBG04_01430, partial [Holosporaceae bacterium]|nr:hypothetical protein [Holosporaceae bacterium]
MMSKMTVREFMASNLSEDAVKKWRETGTFSQQTFSDFFFNILPAWERKEICLRILQKIGMEASVDITLHFCARMIERFSEEKFEDFCWKIKNMTEAALRHGAEISSDAGLNVVV